MSTTKDKYVDMVVELTRLTQKEELIWKRHYPRESLNIDNEKRVDSIFVTEFENEDDEVTYLGLYELHFYYIPIIQQGHASGSVFYNTQAITNVEIEKAQWKKMIVLEILDNNFDSCLWKFPSVRGLRDLYVEVQRQDSSVDSFVNSVLEKSKKDKK
ncbi:MAG: hypothetical protein HQ556_07105 [Candidatus Marinimicrobia bacterium]|nr:hypothetical protein [Candidatus Neomarinimicrobiota bacterium]